jgi:hypothetical protein
MTMNKGEMDVACRSIHALNVSIFIMNFQVKSVEAELNAVKSVTLKFSRGAESAWQPTILESISKVSAPKSAV